MTGPLVHAVLASALLAGAATCLTPLARVTRRPTRYLWLGALLLAAGWPVLLRLATFLAPATAATTPTLGARLLAPVVVGAEQVTSGWSLSHLLLAAWVIASALLLGRLALAAARLTRDRRAWRPDRVDGVAVRVAPDAGPAVVGIGRMEIVVPQWILSLDPALRRLALRHEEEHRAARDPLLLVTAAVLVALLPWNLPLWWMARRLRLAIELDCDARVLRRHPDVARYGRLLLLFAQRPTAARPLAPALLEPVTHLQRRIDAMTRPFSLTTRRVGALGALASLLAGAACTLRVPTNATSTAAPVAATASPAAPTEPADDAIILDGKRMERSQTFFEFQVEKQVTMKRASPPRYPAGLRAAGVSGEVLAQFVVDTAGRAEPSSFKVLKSDHGEFSEAVRATLPLTEFTPAEIGGRRVRQLVQMPYQFSVERSAPVAPAAAPAPQTGFFEFTQDRPARLRQPVAPRYPVHLRAANVEGEVVVAFVIDTTGEAVLSSLKVKRATDPAFVEAVKTALAEMRFEPAVVKGRKVRSLEEMPFSFSLSK